MTNKIRAGAVIVLLQAVFLRPVAGQSLAKFSEQIFMEKDGNAVVVWNIVPACDTLHMLLLPWNFPQSDGATIHLLAQNADTSRHLVEARLIAKEGIRFVRVESADHSALRSMHVTFPIQQFFDLRKEKIIDFGNYIIKKRYINTSIALIDSFSSELVLPAGFVVTSVDETIPKQTEESSISPFVVQKNDGRNSVVVRVAKMKLGEHAFVKMQAKSDAKSSVLFIGLSLIGILYLIFFRDLINRKEVAQNTDKT